MAKKALLRGNAGKFYFIRGTIWELGSFAYRAYLHLVPTDSTLPRWVVSADGMSIKQVLGAAQARARSTAGVSVKTLEVVRNNVAGPRLDTDVPRAPRRYPPPTD
jgi:hypothetical protein